MECQNPGYLLSKLQSFPLRLAGVLLMEEGELGADLSWSPGQSPDSVWGMIGLLQTHF